MKLLLVFPFLPLLLMYVIEEATVFAAVTDPNEGLRFQILMSWQTDECPKLNSDSVAEEVRQSAEAHCQMAFQHFQQLSEFEQLPCEGAHDPLCRRFFMQLQLRWETACSFHCDGGRTARIEEACALVENRQHILTEIIRPLLELQEQRRQEAERQQRRQQRRQQPQSQQQRELQWVQDRRQRRLQRRHEQQQQQQQQQQQHQQQQQQQQPPQRTRTRQRSNNEGEASSSRAHTRTRTRTSRRSP